jgi:bifunctional non-homologous end joining protein LigD
VPPAPRGKTGKASAKAAAGRAAGKGSAKAAAPRTAGKPRAKAAGRTAGKAAKTAAKPRVKTPEQLRRYRAKRDFSRTAEPLGVPGERDGAARFVIQEHSARRLHWDLRLERDGVLVSWALPKGLPETPKDNRFAAATEEHPLEYLDFEGEIPKGEYGAGTMKIWDRGTYECLKWEPRKIEVALHGGRIRARYALFPIAAGEAPKEWLIHRMDPPADAEREAMPERIKPMLATLGKLPADDKRWAHEIKWDGVRAIAYSRPGELELHSRNLKDITAQYPELGRLNRALSSHEAVLDGEIVAFDEDGRPSFEALQRRMHVASSAQIKRLAKGTPVTYMIFDLLWLDGHSLMELPYSERRERLAALGLSGERWQTPEHIVGRGAAVLKASVEQQLEGIVAKRLDSTYHPGRRSPSWIKIKNTGRQEVVIGGWMPGQGRRSERLGALLVGVYETDGVLRYAGRVGTGFTDSELTRLGRLLAPLERARSPFGAGEKPPRGAVFAEPTLVAEVEFREWTTGGSLRAPSYKGLREDKPAREVVREDATVAAPADEREEAEQAARLEIEEQAGDKGKARVEARELSFSNLSKVLYPEAGVVKRDVIEYYAAIAPSLVPHLEGRPLTVKRWPDGVQGQFFFQKHAPSHRPEWVQTVRLPSGRKPIDYLLANDAATVVWLANLAALELHTPLARADAVQRPTALVFDLDPGAPAGIIECCRVGLQLCGMFANLGLQSFAKTSGSKGLQVYVPLNSREAGYEQTKPFAKAVAEMLEQAEGELVVSRMTKARRTGKVLIDWSQNDSRKTTVCVYSLRAGPRPTVSTPVEWDEVRAALDRDDPALLSFEAPQVLERVAARGDLFAPVLSAAQELPAV